MKKIGILTIQKSPCSYGANLQCYALWKYISSLGYDCDVIDLLRPCHKNYQNSIFVMNNNFMCDKRSYISVLKNELLHIIFRRKFYIKPNPYFLSFWSMISYSRVYNLRSLYFNNIEYDVFVTGSDQVWNPTQNYKIAPYFLPFTNRKKVSYASSIGIKKISERMCNIIKPLLKRYDYLSVREEDARKNLSNILKKDVELVVDPTFLLSKEEWISVLEKSSLNLNKKNYILFYSLSYNDDFIKMMHDFINNNNQFEIVIIDYGLNEFVDGVSFINNIGPCEFLSLIYHSKYVITDSFHCMAFSINFYIPFSVIKCKSNEKRISRMESILSICQASSRIVDIESFNINNMCFEFINSENLKLFIDKSKFWLNHSLVD